MAHKKMRKAVRYSFLRLRLQGGPTYAEASGGSSLSRREAVFSEGYKKSVRSGEETMELSQRVPKRPMHLRQLAQKRCPGPFMRWTEISVPEKPCLPRALLTAWASRNRSPRLHLPYFRSMRAAACRCTILMYTVSNLLKKWMKSDTKTAFSARGFRWLSGHRRYRK